MRLACSFPCNPAEVAVNRSGVSRPSLAVTRDNIVEPFFDRINRGVLGIGNLSGTQKRKRRRSKEPLHHCRLPRWSGSWTTFAAKKRLPPQCPAPAPPLGWKVRLRHHAARQMRRCGRSHDFRIHRDVFRTKKTQADSWRCACTKPLVRQQALPKKFSTPVIPRLCES